MTISVETHRVVLERQRRHLAPVMSAKVEAIERARLHVLVAALAQVLLGLVVLFDVDSERDHGRVQCGQALVLRRRRRRSTLTLPLVLHLLDRLEHKVNYFVIVLLARYFLFGLGERLVQDAHEHGHHAHHDQSVERHKVRAAHVVVRLLELLQVEHAQRELEQRAERVGQVSVRVDLVAEDGRSEQTKRKEHNHADDAEAEQVARGVSQRGREHSDAFVESQELDELERGAEHDRAEYGRVGLGPVGDRLKVDKLAQLAGKHRIDRDSCGNRLHDEERNREDGAHDYDEIVPVPEAAQVLFLLLFHLEHLVDDQVDEIDDKDDLED